MFEDVGSMILVYLVASILAGGCFVAIKLRTRIPELRLWMIALYLLVAVPMGLFCSMGILNDATLGAGLVLASVPMVVGTVMGLTRGRVV